MATIRFYNNCFEDQYNEEEYDFSKPLIDQIESHCNTSYTSEYVECYDPETDETFFAPITESEDDISAIIAVNGNTVDKDYIPQSDDMISVVYLPMGSGTDWAKVGFVTAGAVLGTMFLGPLLGILIAPVVGAAWVGFLYDSYKNLSTTVVTNEKGQQKPDVRGSSNTSLLNNPYPFVIGKHLVTPFVIGDPYTTYSGVNGKDAKIRIAYCAGYAPLKLTDFKLEEFFLAYNGSRNGNPTYMNGLLKGCSGDDADNGDILNRWSNNDISLEILQHNPNDTEVNYGTVFPDKITQKEIKANVLYLTDDRLTDNAELVYKGTTFADKFRTNGVWFTESCPMEFTIVLNAASGLYRSYTYTENNKSEEKYDQIPLWYAVQWRPYDVNNRPSDSEGLDYKNWRNITVFDEYGNTFAKDFNSFMATADIAAHKGNTITDSAVKSKYMPKAVKDSDALTEVLKRTGATSDTNLSITSNGVSANGKYFYKGNPSLASDEWIVGKVLSSSKGLSALFNGKTQCLYFDESPSELSSEQTHFVSDICDYVTVSLDTPITFKLNNVRKLKSYNSASSNTKTIEVKSYVLCRKYYTEHSSAYTDVYGCWYRQDLLNFESITGKVGDHDGTGQIRLSAKVTLSEEQMKEMLASSNKVKAAEIRVIRVSPNYINQSSSDVPQNSANSAESYSDVITVDMITTKSFDETRYYETGNFEPVKIQSKENMKKFCYIAIEAKADAMGNIQSQLKQLSCIAESFSPIWQDHKWLPENVKRVTKYYGYYEDNAHTIKCNRTSSAKEVEVTKSEYEAARGEGYSWLAVETGSDFTDKMKAIIYPSNNSQRVTHNNKTADRLSVEASLYNDATAASGFMLAAVGNHNGGFALGYENIDTLSVSECWEAQQSVSDGSTYSENDGAHIAGSNVEVKFEANGYIYQSLKLEDLLSKTAIAGRCVYSYDDLGRIRLIMDKPVDYAKGVINSQNIISLTNAYTYETLPAGLRIQFSDENDGYENNSLYCWSDGNSVNNYKGNVEAYNLDFVTKNTQAWSLGRYFLANKELNREALTAKIGIEGNTYSLGDVLLVNSDELLIGDGSGRIQEVITDGSLIYGFIMDSVYEYKGEVENNKSTKGVQILHPKKYGDARISVHRLATPGKTYTVGDTVYIFTKGRTNLVLFDETIDATDDITIDDIVQFGDYSKISVKYRITKIKPEKDTFTYTLIQYNEDLYNYGKALPSFQNYMTIPSPTSEGITLSEVPTSIKEENEVAVKSTFGVNQILSNLYSSHTVYLYKKSNTPLTSDDLPKVVPEYNFKTNELTYNNEDWDESSANGGWYVNKERTDEGEGEVYMTAATARGQTEYDEIDTSEWAVPVPYGVNGTDGVNTYTIVLYKRQEIAPDTTPQNVTYDFYNTELKGDLKGWSTGYPSVDDEGNPVWEIHATAFGTDSVVDVNNWSSVKQISNDVEITKAQVTEWINEAAVTPSPTVYSDVSFIGVQTDSQSIATVDQSITANFTVLQTGEELDFTFGIITPPLGWNVTQIGRSLVFTVRAGTVVSSGNINIPVIFRPYISNYAYTDNKDADSVYTDETNTPYGYAIFDTEETIYNLSMAYTQVKGGRYLGPITSASSIPTDLLVGDYFTWTGASTTEFLQTSLYIWDGIKWKPDTSSEHNMSALSDILSLGADVLAENNSTVNMFLNRLTANEAFIGKLIVTGSAFINALSTFEIVMGDGSRTGSIHSYGFIKGSSGWCIEGNGEAEFNNLKVRGEITATSLILEESEETTESLKGYIDDHIQYAYAEDIQDNYNVDASLLRDKITLTLYKNGELCTDTLYCKVSYINTEDGTTYQTDAVNSRERSEWSDVQMPYTGNRYKVKIEIFEDDTFEKCYASAFLSMGLRGENGSSVYSVDLSNEMDSVSLSSEGKTTQSHTLTTIPSMHYGSQTLEVTGITASAVSSITPIFNTTTKVISVVIGENKSFDKLEFPITVKALHNGSEVTGNVVFTVQGVKVGADGKNSVTYSLRPSASSISKNKNGTYNPTSISCEVLKTDGNNAAQVISTGYTLKYYTDGSATGKTYSDAINTSSFTKSIKFELTVNNIVVDIETINIVTDGADGSSVYSIDIDNEMDSVGLTSDGLTDKKYVLYTTPKMYYGTTELTVSSINSVTVEDITPLLTGGKQIEVTIPANKSLSKLIFPITVNARHNNQTVSRAIEFTVQGVKAGGKGDNAVIYSLNPSVSSVTKYKDDSYSVSSVTCKVLKTNGSSQSEADSSEYTLQYYINGSSSPKTYSGEIATSSFTTLKLNLKVNNTIVDTETINVVTDGKDGASGGYMQYKFAIGGYNLTDAQLAQLDWKDSPVPVTTEAPYLWMRTEWIEGE